MVGGEGWWWRYDGDDNNNNNNNVYDDEYCCRWVSYARARELREWERVIAESEREHGEWESESEREYLSLILYILYLFAPAAAAVTRHCGYRIYRGRRRLLTGAQPPRRPRSPRARWPRRSTRHRRRVSTLHPPLISSPVHRSTTPRMYVRGRSLALCSWPGSLVPFHSLARVECVCVCVTRCGQQTIGRHVVVPFKTACTYHGDAVHYMCDVCAIYAP